LIDRQQYDYFEESGGWGRSHGNYDGYDGNTGPSSPAFFWGSWMHM